MTRSGLTAAAGFLVLLFGLASPSSAYRDYFTKAQKAELANIGSVLVEALVLTERGPGNADGIRDTVLRRMSELGYVVSSDQGAPHDVVVRVKCEQKKTWEGTAAAGGDNDLPDAPSRLWKGPACQLTYSLGSLKVKWQKEVRTGFEDAAQAAHAAGAADPSAFAISALRDALEHYDFPLLLTAEWGQPERLLKLLDSPQSNQLRKLRIISLLGEMAADEALPHLTEALKDKDLAKQAAVALGNMGKEGIPVLIELLRSSKHPDLQAAAAKGLGDLGNVHSDSRVVPPLLEMLDAPGIDIAVQTEIAWALGRVPDRRSIEPLLALDRKLQKIRNDPPDPQIKKLKEAVFWSIKQVYTEDSSAG